MNYSNDYLCHYGVLGMKWGQHLFGKTSARKQARAQRKADIAEGKKYETYTQKQQNNTSRAFAPVLGAWMGGFYSLMGAQVATMTVAALPVAPIAIGGAALGAVTASAVNNHSINNRYADVGAAARRRADYATNNMQYAKQVQDKADEYDIAARVKMV